MTRTRWSIVGKGAALLAAIVVLLALPMNLSPYGVDIMVLTLVYGILALGLDVLMGYTGLDSLAQGAFFGIATYTMGIATVNHSKSWLFAAGLALVACLGCAGVFGLLAVRLRGLYFLLITLALGQLLWGGVQRWGSFTGGFNGLSGVPRPFGLYTSVDFAYFALAVFLVVLMAVRLLVSSPFGLGLQGCRDNELRVRTLGFRSTNLKWLAFVIAGVCAGIGGVLGATYNSFVSPSDLSLQLSFSIMLMVIVGGGGTVYGAVIGAAIVTALQYELSIYIADWWVLILGAVYVVTTLFLPEGVVGAYRRAVAALRARRGASDTSASAAPSALGAAPAGAWDGSDAGNGRARVGTPAGAGPGSSVAAFAPPGLRSTAAVTETDRGAAAQAPSGNVGASRPVLSLTDITKDFGGFRVLDGIALSFQGGERTAIIGPNGAGKTTLFNVISGLEAPSSGDITVDDTRVTHRPPQVRTALGLARTFQITKLFSSLTVMENITLGLLGWTDRKRQYTMWKPSPLMRDLRDRARHELVNVGLDEYRNVLVRHLSYGHQKQLDIALALASNPRLLLLDEPTAGLSHEETARMMKLVETLPDNVTVLIIEHNVDVVFRLTDRLIVLDRGQVVMDGPQATVRDSDEVRRIYFGTAV